MLLLNLKDSLLYGGHIRTFQTQFVSLNSTWSNSGLCCVSKALNVFNSLESQGGSWGRWWVNKAQDGDTRCQGSHPDYHLWLELDNKTTLLTFNWNHESSLTLKSLHILSVLNQNNDLLPCLTKCGECLNIIMKKCLIMLLSPKADITLQDRTFWCKTNEIRC